MAMTTPIALQLYTLREATARDFAGTLEKVAATGYLGVETTGFAGTTVPAAAQLFKDLGLTVCAAHLPLPLGENQTKVLETMQALGCHRLVCASQPRQEFQTVDGIQRVCDTLNAASAVAQAHGLRLGYHNHWWEFQTVAGRLAHARLRDGLAPEVFFEIDTYWTQTAGVDAARVLHELGPRAALLHLKDGPAVQGQPMLALGEGVMDIPGLLQASAGQAEWLIVELDECATDMLLAVQRSYHYLIGKGLGRGKN
jgi:sugar phosphate isomerase/epimerase